MTEYHRKECSLIHFAEATRRQWPNGGSPMEWHEQAPDCDCGAPEMILNEAGTLRKILMSMPNVQIQPPHDAIDREIAATISEVMASEFSDP